MGDETLRGNKRRTAAPSACRTAGGLCICIWFHVGIEFVVIGVSCLIQALKAKLQQAEAAMAAAAATTAGAAAPQDDDDDDEDMFDMFG